MCIPTHEQGLHADAYPATSGNIYWMSDVWKGVSECSISLKTWKEGSCHPDCGGRKQVSACVLNIDHVIL